MSLLSPLVVRWCSTNFRTLNAGRIHLCKNACVRSRHSLIRKYPYFQAKQSTLYAENHWLVTKYVLDNPSSNSFRIAMCKYSSTPTEEPDKPAEKLTLIQRYKKMLKEYWYVLLPVHLVTSAVWFGSFYYAAKSGIDIIPFLERLGIGESYLSPLRSTGLGYIAVATAMYKIATPARYAITVGTTTVAVNYLSKRGLLPSKNNLTQMMKDKKDTVVKKFRSKS